MTLVGPTLDRPLPGLMAPAPRRVTLRRVGLAAIALGAGAVAAVEIRAASRNPFDLDPRLLAAQVTVYSLVGFSFVGSAIVALTRRPGNDVGALLAFVGFVWFLEGLEFTGNAVAFSIAYAASGRFLAPLAHLFLVFPNGSLRSTGQRWLVVAVYAWAVIGATLSTVVFDFGTAGCDGCPSNVFMIADRPELHEALGAIESAVSVALAVLVFLTVRRRWHGVTGPTRRALRPVIWATGPALVVVALFALVDMGLVPRPVASAASPFLQLALAVLPVAFLVGLLRTRLDRAMIADLLVQLRDPVPHGHLRDVLARVLRDPSLEVAFRLPGSEDYVDADGRPVQLPTLGDERRAVTMVESGGRPLAALIHDEALLDDHDLIGAVGSAARLALENERLQAELRAQLEEVRASRARIVSAADDARRKIERDLHDGAQQRLLALALTISAARSKAETGADHALDGLLGEALDEARTAVTELRELARGIHPALLTDAGLGPALETLVRRAAVPARVATAPERRLPSAVEAAAYFFVAEALANAAKHAHATRAVVAATLRSGRLVVDVSDDGVGGADRSGSGLRGLEDRVAALGGSMHVESSPGGGTRLVADIPVATDTDEPPR